eukprot:141592-Chlamydomonas_euryale.AAC.1
MYTWRALRVTHLAMYTWSGLRVTHLAMYTWRALALPSGYRSRDSATVAERQRRMRMRAEIWEAKDRH